MTSGHAIIVDPGKPEEQSDMFLAQQVAHALNQHYPDHPWTVDVQGQGLVLRHQMISMVAAAALRREGFGFLLPRNKMGSPKQVKQSAIQAGGSMLELFGLPRGRDTGKLPEVPRDWVPKQEKGFA